MEGLSEDGGAEFDRLLGLAEDSSGTTQSKYEIAVSGVNGALEELKATFDSVVASVVESGLIEDVLTGITKILGGVSQLAKEGKLIPTVIKAITGALELMIAKTLALGAAKAFLAAVSAGANGDGYTAGARIAMVTAAVAGAGAVIAGIAGVNNMSEVGKNVGTA